MAHVARIAKGGADMDRNAYGYPLDIALLQAKEKAAIARENNKPDCQCPTCREMEMLPKVQNIIARWKS